MSQEMLSSVVLLQNLGTVVALNGDYYDDEQLTVMDLRESDGCIEVTLKGDIDHQIRVETPGINILMPSAVFVDQKQVNHYHPWVTHPVLRRANAILQRVSDESLERSRHNLRHLLYEQEWQGEDDSTRADGFTVTPNSRLTRRQAARLLSPILARHLN